MATPNRLLFCESGCKSTLTDVLRKWLCGNSKFTDAFYKSGCVATPNSELCVESGCTSKLTDVLRRVDVRQPHTNKYVTKVCLCANSKLWLLSGASGCVATSQPQMHPAKVAVWQLHTDKCLAKADIWQLPAERMTCCDSIGAAITH